MTRNEVILLPFLAKNRNNNAGVIVKTREADSKPDHSESSDLEACAEDLCHAIDRKDYKAIAEAFKAMFELCELEPHEEGPHEPHSYDSQNQIAAEGNE